MRPSAPFLKKRTQALAERAWLREQLCIAPKADAAFVCNMEDVLEVYKRPLDDKRPLLCMDEMPKQLLIDARAFTRYARKARSPGL